MKKFLALLLALVMVISLAACGGKPAPETEAPAAPATEAPVAEAPATEAPEPELEPVTLKIWFHGSNVQPEASAKVMAELNAYLQEKINVTLEPIWGTWGNFDEGVKTALAAGGDGVDIYFTCNWSGNEYNKYARDGYWVKLDDMMAEYAPELQAIMPEGMWNLAKTNGMDGYGVYAIPGMKDTATQNVWDINGTLLAELGYDVDAVVAEGIDFYSDKFEEMLQKAKDAKGADFYPLNIEAVVLERMVTHTAQITGDLSSTNILSYYYDAEHPAKDIGSEFVNKFSTPEFKKYAERIHYLAQKGFISPQAQNVGTANDYLNATRASANYLIGTEVYAYGCEKNFSQARGIDIRMVPETVPFRDATSGQGAMMAISSASANPERALMFLNLLNTDPAVMTYVNYGAEGFTYSKNADGTISFIEEGRSQYTPWTNGVGNVGILPDTDVEGAGFRDEFIKFYNADYESVPYGAFTFDNSDYEVEMTAIGDVAARYAFGLMSGAVAVDDPVNGLDAFLKDLEAAGINDFVAAVNEQFAAYAAN